MIAVVIIASPYEYVCRSDALFSIYESVALFSGGRMEGRLALKHLILG